MEEKKPDQEIESVEALEDSVAEAPAPEESLQERLRILQEENLQTKEQLLRLAAEFDNYRKRMERDLGVTILNANADLVLSLLPVVDDLERVLSAEKTAVTAEAMGEAVRLVYKNFMRILQDAGLAAMNAVDQPFDPEKHDALLHVPVEGKAPDLVVEEHKKGYTFRDRVLRHAQVIVSK
ncbi:MAG TPA: nucleotide exchange factor GrpE [bacterium]|nr:nucleotide exchange factor GrpE [bacterium]HPN33835.1 nucleotide exchange factor GrpE [bacterium]